MVAGSMVDTGCFSRRVHVKVDRRIYEKNHTERYKLFYTDMHTVWITVI